MSFWNRSFIIALFCLNKRNNGFGVGCIRHTVCERYNIYSMTKCIFRKKGWKISLKLGRRIKWELWITCHEIFSISYLAASVKQLFRFLFQTTKKKGKSMWLYLQKYLFSKHQSLIQYWVIKEQNYRSLFVSINVLNGI